MMKILRLTAQDDKCRCKAGSGFFRHISVIVVSEEVLRGSDTRST
jgi:hypothetical protein